MIRLRKTDIYTGEVLEDAEFTVLQWNRGKQTYQNNLGGQSILKFDIENGWYSTEELVLTDDNQGRFKVVETKNPENYTGKYEKEVIFQKKENTDTDTVDLKAENTPVTLPLGNITINKKDQRGGYYLGSWKSNLFLCGRRYGSIRKSSQI